MEKVCVGLWVEKNLLKEEVVSSVKENDRLKENKRLKECLAVKYNSYRRHPTWYIYSRGNQLISYRNIESQPPYNSFRCPRRVLNYYHLNKPFH